MRWIHTCIVVFVLCLCVAEKAEAKQKAVLKQKYSVEQANVYRSTCPDSALLVMDSLLRKYQSQGFGKNSEVNFYYSYGLICARANQARQSIKYLVKALSTDSTHAHPSFSAQICAALSEQYMFLGIYDQSLSYAFKAYEKAKKAKNKEDIPTCLAVIGNVYCQMAMYEKAHLYLDKAIAVTGFTEERMLYQYVKGNVYAQEEKYVESADLMQSLLDQLNKLSPQDLKKTYYSNPIELAYFKAEILSQRSYSLIMAHQEVAAKEACDQAIALIHPIDQIRMPVYLALFNYMEQAKEWGLLIQEIKRILPKLEMGDSINNYHYLIQEYLAQAYQAKGDYAKAYSSKSQAMDLYQKLSEKKNMNLALELSAVYETAEKDAQITSQKYVIQKQRGFFITLGVISVFLLVILVLIYTNAQSTKFKNRKLFEQMRIVKDLAVKKEEGARDGNKEESKLFTLVEQWMRKEKAYLLGDISRKEVATALSTNETYLCNAIREACGLSFQNYIYKLRLEEARQILSLFSETATIETIAYDCGFNSARNFHRLFRKEFGMTPTEFRRLAKSDSERKA